MKNYTCSHKVHQCRGSCNLLHCTYKCVRTVCDTIAKSRSVTCLRMMQHLQYVDWHVVRRQSEESITSRYTIDQ